MFACNKYFFYIIIVVYSCNCIMSEYTESVPFDINRTILSLEDIHEDENIYYRLSNYYLNRQDYINSSQAMYAYVIALYKLFSSHRMLIDRDYMLAIWSECTKAALLAVSCMKLVKSEMQWFIPMCQLYPQLNNIIVYVDQLELEYLKCKSILSILILSKDIPNLIRNENSHLGIDQLLDIMSTYDSLGELSDSIKKRRKKVGIVNSILY